jgi:aminoglycoside phosphotransferase family enzyme
MSWVFLTAQHAYKLKKPVHYPFLDFSKLAAREHYCREELRLNRRLAPAVYLDVVTLRRSRGKLSLDSGDGEIVDYLVKMTRLPTEKMLDRVLCSHNLQRGDIRTLAETLAGFYRTTKKGAQTVSQYRARLAATINENGAQLSQPRYKLPSVTVANIVKTQLDFVANSDALAQRGAHLVDAHGDLRPEHICLCKPLQIIDCLEFQNELRQLDPLDELTFLAIECERLGSAHVGTALLRMYCTLSGDRAPPAVIAFYRTHRAMTRAVLAIWHLDDPGVRERAVWHQRALGYIEIAARAIVGIT